MAEIIPSPNIFSFFYDKDGLPLSGGKLYTYKSGTNTLKDTYTDSTGTSLNTNPIVLNDAGGCRLFLYTSQEAEIQDSYRFELFDNLDQLISTEDNIYSVNGKDGTSTGLVGERGKTGEDGLKGNSIPGKRGQQGEIGPAAENGMIDIMFRTAGVLKHTIPDGVESANFTLLGAGPSTLLSTSIPNINEVATGTAGQLLEFTKNVSAGDIITINVGAGGTASSDEVTAGGKSTYIESSLIPRVTANGGNPGSNGTINVSQNYFQKMNRFLSYTLFDGSSINIIPRAVIGESTKFGTGGNIYMNGDPDAKGNGSSGGTGIPTLNGNVINIANYGKGGDGLVIISYIKPSDD